MPQTEEHLAIVELLGVRRGVPVLTKSDAADPEWLDLVRADVAARLARSAVRWEAPVITSAVTGEGLDALRAALGRAADGVAPRTATDLFRLPIDRVFAVAGAGTVVTGSTWSGTVAAGDLVHVLPLERDVRVRSVEVHGQPAREAVPGRRTALALVGVDRSELARGDVVVTGPGWAATRALDVAIELLPSAPRPLGPRTRLRVHLGTAEVLARVGQVGGMLPGERGHARLMLEAPIVARGGDRFVLRSYSPVTTVGGGLVLDPFPPARPRVGERRLGVDQHPGDRMAAWVEEAGLRGVSADDLPVRLGIVPHDVTEIIDRERDTVVRSGSMLVAGRAVADAVERLQAALAHHHEKRPLDPGMSLQALRGVLPGETPGPVADLVLEQETRAGALELDGGLARRQGWQPRLDGDAGRARGEIERRLREARWQIPTLAELEGAFPKAPVRALLAQLVREGVAEQVDQERYAAAPALQAFHAALDAALRDLGRGTPAQLRDRFGLSRKYLIPLLEWADRRGITQREGNDRMLRS
jgi:selenocysteine-specific elongation factor